MWDKRTCEDCVHNNDRLRGDKCFLCPHFWRGGDTIETSCSKEITSEFEQLILDAVKLNKENRKRKDIIDAKGTLTPIAYIREFCTVHLDIGRATGKTAFIKKYATEGDVILTFSAEQLNIFKRSLAVALWPAEVDDLVTVAKIPANTVYIDEPKLLFKLVGNYSEIIWHLIKDTYYNQTFILLGE